MNSDSAGPAGSGSVRVWGTLDRQPVLHPVLFAAEIHVNVAVPELVESPRRDLGVVARPAAVHHDRSVFVGQQRRCQPVDLVRWHVDRARDAGGVVLVGTTHVEDGHLPVVPDLCEVGDGYAARHIPWAQAVAASFRDGVLKLDLADVSAPRARLAFDSWPPAGAA